MQCNLLDSINQIPHHLNVIYISVTHSPFFFFPLPSSCLSHIFRILGKRADFTCSHSNRRPEFLGLGLGWGGKGGLSWLGMPSYSKKIHHSWEVNFLGDTVFRGLYFMSCIQFLFLEFLGWGRGPRGQGRLLLEM
jgi:hypothetical protein